ncbi:MAG: ATP-binding protein [Planctomycetes bacterium]|nr:ATP-binding protein [Planctomycetota bacterium]
MNDVGSQLGKGAKRVQITASEKIIADISTGIYRTPAAALKELIANAYDADATEVRISTDVPRFSQLVVKDDGSGMALERFLEVLQHIGGSRKRLDSPSGLTPIHKRKFIGRIGIGLLAVAQLGQRFYVSSTVKGQKTRFLAEVDLRPFHKEDAALRRLGGDRPENDDDIIDIGSVRYVDGLPETADSHYTVITVPDPKAGLISEMLSQMRDFVGSKPHFTLTNRARTFRKIVETVQSSKRADIVLDSYHYLAWEIGLLCPVKYLDGGPFKQGSRRVEGAEGIGLEEPKNFKVLLDGLDVRRPILFPNPRAVGYSGPDPIVHPISWKHIVAKRPVEITGYIYVQQPHVDAHELNGVQLRVRGVGVGPYDKSLLGYPYDEGIKFGQVSGEIYVKEGLESALNIDRSSFRETDPHYLAIRAHLWHLLQTKIFPTQKSRQNVVKVRRDAERLESDEKELAEALTDAPARIGARPIVAASRKTVEPEPRRKGSTRAVDKGAAQARKPDRALPSETSGYQSIVTVVGGQAHVDKAELERVAARFKLNKDGKTRLMRVAVALAAYDVWDSVSPEEAKGLFSALAAAVRS